MQDLKRCIVSLMLYHFTTTGFHFLFQFMSSVQVHDDSVEVVFCFHGSPVWDIGNLRAYKGLKSATVQSRIGFGRTFLKENSEKAKLELRCKFAQNRLRSSRSHVLQISMALGLSSSLKWFFSTSSHALAMRSSHRPRLSE